jgi:hypothetical protein
MSTRFFTNHGEQTLVRKFRGVFENNADIEWFDALVGYLRVSGYFAICPFLSNGPHNRTCFEQIRGYCRRVRDDHSKLWFKSDVCAKRRAATSIKLASARRAAKIRAS